MGAAHAAGRSVTGDRPTLHHSDGPSKTFNIPGLGASFAIIQHPELRRRFKQAMRGIVPDVNILALTAALAAYRHGGEWLRDLLTYLAANRDFLVEHVARHWPELRATVPEATYLAWLDCRNAGIAGNPQLLFPGAGRRGAERRRNLRSRRRRFRCG